MSANPVVIVYKNTLGSHAAIDNIANVSDGSTVTIRVRTPDTGVLFGGGALNYQQGLGGSGNPLSVGYELTPNVEYEFTLTAQIGSGLAGTDYQAFIYNNSFGSISFEVVTTTQRG